MRLKHGKISKAVSIREAINMSAEGVASSQIVAQSNKSKPAVKSKIPFSSDSNSSSTILDTISKNLGDSSDSAAVALSISRDGINMMQLSFANKRSTDLGDIILDSFSDSENPTENRQRDIVKTVADVIRPYDSIEETRAAILDQKIEISTPTLNREINGLSIKLAYELNSYLSSFGSNNQFFTRLENSIKSNNVVDNPIVDKVLEMVGDVKKGNEIDFENVDFRIGFNNAINATFNQVGFEQPVDYSEAQKQIEERLLTYDTIYDDTKDRNSATLDNETMNMLFNDEVDDENKAVENEERRVNAGREILKRTLMIRESIDRTNEIIKSLAFKDAIRHLDDESLEERFPQFFSNDLEEVDQDGNRNSI